MNLADLELGVVGSKALPVWNGPKEKALLPSWGEQGFESLVP